MSSVSSGNFSQIAGSYADTAAVYSKSETTGWVDADNDVNVQPQP